MILLIDNYDSFTYNIVQALLAQGAQVEVRRNDAISAQAALEMGAQGIVLSPGPGKPADSGICPELLARANAQTPVLGVCLGHQALVERWGGIIERDSEPVHGRASAVVHDARGVFAGLPVPFEAGRYHSLRARRDSLPSVLELCAWTQDGIVMGVRHRTLPHHGVQFHPESILTPLGNQLLANFVELCALHAST